MQRVFPSADFDGILLLADGSRRRQESRLQEELEALPDLAELPDLPNLPDFPNLPETLWRKARELGRLCLSQSDEESRASFEMIRNDILNDRPRGLLQLDAIRLLYHVTDTFPGQELSRKYYSKSQRQIANEVWKLLTSHPEKRYSAAELAKRFHISETSLKNYFSGIYSCGYREFQNEMRMVRAAELLEREGGKVSEICYEVGFSTQSAFARAFRKYYGVTPVEYRRQKGIEHKK